LSLSTVLYLFLAHLGVGTARDEQQCRNDADAQEIGIAHV